MISKFLRKWRMQPRVECYYCGDPLLDERNIHWVRTDDSQYPFCDEECHHNSVLQGFR